MSTLKPFERRHRWTGWLTWLAVLCGSAAIYSVAVFAFGYVIGFVVCAPIVGTIVAYLLVNNAGAGVRSIRWLVMHKVNGQYYSFDNLEVRIDWHEGQCRVAAKDVFNVMQVKPDLQSCKRLAVRYGANGLSQDERGQWWFSEAAIIQWLSFRLLRFDNRAMRFRFWLERDVFPPMHKKAEIAGMAPDDHDGGAEADSSSQDHDAH